MFTTWIKEVQYEVEHVIWSYASGFKIQSFVLQKGEQTYL